MSNPLDPENDWKNKIADQTLDDLIEITNSLTKLYHL
jgi:hypothetical protein